MILIEEIKKPLHFQISQARYIFFHFYIFSKQKYEDATPFHSMSKLTHFCGKHLLLQTCIPFCTPAVKAEAPSSISLFSVFFFNPQCQESPASQMTNVTTLVLWPLRHIHDILHFHIPTGITNIFMTLYPKVPRFQSSEKLEKSEVNRKSIEMC